MTAVGGNPKIQVSAGHIVLRVSCACGVTAANKGKPDAEPIDRDGDEARASAFAGHALLN
jgi:hypothetical protein